MTYQAYYKKSRTRAGICRDCPNPVVNNSLCLACRNKNNARRSQRHFDRWVDREDHLVKRLHLLNYKLAAEVLGVEVISIRDYVTEGLLTVKRHELRQAWVPREEVARIGQLRQAGGHWKGKFKCT